eukprot:1193332-Prorocentrum_minimum.AAC.1
MRGYTRGGDQSEEGQGDIPCPRPTPRGASAAAGRRSGEDIPEAGTNRRRDERIYPGRGPIGEGTRGYTLPASDSERNICSCRAEIWKSASLNWYGTLNPSGPNFSRSCKTHTHTHTQDQSDAGSAGVFSRRTNLTQEAQVYSHGGPIRRTKRGNILTTDQSDAGSAHTQISTRTRTRTHTHTHSCVNRMSSLRRTQSEACASVASVVRFPDWTVNALYPSGLNWTGLYPTNRTGPYLHDGVEEAEAIEQLVERRVAAALEELVLLDAINLNTPK